jgi:uncharacterized membrane protein
MLNADPMLTTEAVTAKVYTSTRIHSIDFLRGVVMVLMAIDHTRTFLHEDFHQFNAEDLAQTTPVLFFTRWITHFCAPVFIFLVGTSAYLMLQKVQSKKQVFSFLVTRGLFLILLELTLFRLCWQSTGAFFNPFISLLVIWAIGVSMIFLALLIYLPFRAILLFGLLVLFLHNTLAGVSFPEGSGMATFWAFFYSGGIGSLPGGIGVFFLYPVLTYFGLVALGYCLGYLYTPDFTRERRRAILIGLGTGALVLFVALRYFNVYGDPRPWEAGKNTLFSIMAFLRTTKYPVSLLYALMTLGPALIALGLIEPVKNRVVKFFVTIGEVPMFYYILHLVFIALISFMAGSNSYDLLAVYGFFVVQVSILYLLCRWYSGYKSEHPEKKWLKYI